MYLTLCVRTRSLKNKFHPQGPTKLKTPICRTGCYTGLYNKGKGSRLPLCLPVRLKLCFVILNALTFTFSTDM